MPCLCCVQVGWLLAFVCSPLSLAIKVLCLEGSFAVVTCSANWSRLDILFALSLTVLEYYDAPQLEYLTLLHHGRCRSHLLTPRCTHHLVHELAILYAGSKGEGR